MKTTILLTPRIATALLYDDNYILKLKIQMTFQEQRPRDETIDFSSRAFSFYRHCCSKRFSIGHTAKAFYIRRLPHIEKEKHLRIIRRSRRLMTRVRSMIKRRSIRCYFAMAGTERSECDCVTRRNVPVF